MLCMARSLITRKPAPASDSKVAKINAPANVPARIFRISSSWLRPCLPIRFLIEGTRPTHLVTAEEAAG